MQRNTVPLPPNLVNKLARNLLENPRGRMQIQFRLMADKRKENPMRPSRHRRRKSSVRPRMPKRCATCRSSSR